MQTVCPGVERGCCVSRHAICRRDGMVHPVDVAFAAQWLRDDEAAALPASALLGTSHPNPGPNPNPNPTPTPTQPQPEPEPEP